MLGTYLTNTFFMLIILLIILIRSKSAFQRKSNRKPCLLLISTTMCYVLMDGIFIACDLTEECPNSVFSTAVLIFYLAYSALPIVWHLFVRSFVGTSFNSTLRKLEYIPAVVLAAFILITPFTGALYSIADDGSYIRGPLFTAYSVLNLFYYVEPLLDTIVIHLRHDEAKEKYYRQSMLISFVPLLATLINSFAIPIYQIYPFQPICAVIVALLAFCYIASMDSDFARQKNSEQIQSALQKAEDANLAKTKFLSNMSHDIRTPMNAIINLSELAQKEQDINVVREYLSKIEIAGNFLLGLIGDILDVSRIENGKLQLNKENLTRAEFLKTVETVARPLMDARHINFHLELRPGAYTIHVDKLRFNQIFFNLLSNAAKFTPEGGDVWFEVSNLKTKGNMLTIKFVVRDNGIGMSDEFLQHIFEPFAREHSQLNSKVTGTGLGLSIVKSLVDAMGGTISVTSKLGEGTEFVVLFDAEIVSEDNGSAVTAPDESKVLPEQADKLKGMRVLLAEDNELNTYVARIILEGFGCVVATATNGQEAIDAFNASEPFSFNAILMDVRMPVMDGFKASQLIRSSNRTDSASIPIIAVTADVFEEERQLIGKMGMNYYLPKPLDSRQLYDALLKCCAGSKKS